MPLPFFPKPAFMTMNAAPISRRNALRLTALTLAAVCISPSVRPAYALKPGKPSKEKLLRDIREEKTPEEIEEEKIRVAEEKKIRLAKQRELQLDAENRKNGLVEDPKKDDIEATLRGQYYYPTARKRYLARLKLAWEVLPDVQTAAINKEWPIVSQFSMHELSDAVLPMKLYASSLAGGGLSINAKFIQNMNSQTDAYDGALKRLTKAVKRKDSADAVDILTTMKDAISKYRQLGRLEAADFGIGEIPTDARVGSGFANNNSALYRKNKTIQDVTNGSR